MTSEAVEDYLRAIFEIENRIGIAPTSELAESLDVKPPSVTEMIKRLVDMKLVTREPYRGVTLTEDGRRRALKLIRLHRLIELYLYKILNVGWEKVHDEAHRLEHVISDEVAEKMDEALGYPEFDPHGSPIPSIDGSIGERDSVELSAVSAGMTVHIDEVSDRDSDLLGFLGERGILPGTVLEVVARYDFADQIDLKVGDSVFPLGLKAAEKIRVSKTSSKDKKE